MSTVQARFGGLWYEAGAWGTSDEVRVIDAKRSRAGILLCAYCHTPEMLTVTTHR